MDICIVINKTQTVRAFDPLDTGRVLSVLTIHQHTHTHHTHIYTYKLVYFSRVEGFPRLHTPQTYCCRQPIYNKPR